MYFFIFQIGDCDVAETCNGVSGNCPADAFKSQWALCPGGAKKPGHDCDEFEFCSGSSPNVRISNVLFKLNSMYNCVLIVSSG